MGRAPENKAKKVAVEIRSAKWAFSNAFKSFSQDSSFTVVFLKTIVHYNSSPQTFVLSDPLKELQKSLDPFTWFI